MAAAMRAEGLSADEYAARYAHGIMCFSLDECRYPDAALDAWISRLGQILNRAPGAPTLTELRVKYLTFDERESVEREEREEF